MGGAADLAAAHPSGKSQRAPYAAALKGAPDPVAGKRGGASMGEREDAALESTRGAKQPAVDPSAGATPMAEADEGAPPAPLAAA